MMTPVPLTRIYCARGMSNRPQDEVVQEAIWDKTFFEQSGEIQVLDPVSEEGVPAENKLLLASQKEMDANWPRDKELIRQCHVFVNMSPHLPSLGVTREYGYARYYLQKPCISVFPYNEMPKPGAICYYEDDFVTDMKVVAASYIVNTFGSLEKRLKWRLRKQIPTWPKRTLARLGEWK